jgi:hypothetical protein
MYMQWSTNAGMARAGMVTGVRKSRVCNLANFLCVGLTPCLNRLCISAVDRI